VLAGGREFQLTSDAAQAKAVARTYFEHRFASGPAAEGNPVLTKLELDTAAFTILAESSATIPTPFLGVAGMSSMTVKAKSQSKLAVGGSLEGKDVEVSMMLDLTGSMGGTTATGTKIEDAKLAAKDLVDILLPAGVSASNSVRVAIAPFSQYVNVGTTYYETVTSKPPSGGNTCVTERTGSHAYDDESPTVSKMHEYNPNSNHGQLACAPTSEIVPLTNNRTSLHAAIDGFTADGFTAGHLGTAWAWYLLSHKWSDVWPAASIPAAPGPNVVKIAILMTDGDYNTEFNGQSSNSQAAQLCTNMKASGIEVYTIGFGDSLSDTAKALLENCASSQQHYFLASDGNALRQKFSDIAIAVANLRLTQ
jgi:hypothetical protein